MNRGINEHDTGVLDNNILAANADRNTATGQLVQQTKLIMVAFGIEAKEHQIPSAAKYSDDYSRDGEDAAYLDQHVRSGNDVTMQEVGHANIWLSEVITSLKQQGLLPEEKETNDGKDLDSFSK